LPVVDMHPFVPENIYIPYLPLRWKDKCFISKPLWRETNDMYYGILHISQWNNDNFKENSISNLLDFFIGEVCITQENVQELMAAADMLQLREVVLGCTQFLKTELHPSNAVGIYR
jgi:hypothetical protein